MTFDQLSIALASLAILIVVAYTAHAKLRFEGLPTNLPWVGRQYGFLADLRTRAGSMGNLLPSIESGYRKYSKAGINFILPCFDRAFILVPGSQVKWITEQADNVLSAASMQIEVLQTDYTLLDPSMARNPIHETIVRRDLTRSLGALIPDIHEELNVAIDEYLGKDTENWVDISVFSDMQKIVARISNRIFVGLPLCRNEEYLVNAGKFATDIAVTGAVMRSIPGIIKPLLAWIVILPNRWHLYKCSKHLLPFVRQRIADLSARRQGESKAGLNDFTTWYLDEVADHPDAAERAPEKVVKRLMTVNFAAIHTSTFTATNIIFDLLSSPNAAENIQEIREEMLHVLSEHGGKWDKNAVAQLVKTDSAVRESLRISTFMSHGMDRMVVSPDGVTMQDGLHLPAGSRIATSTFAIHHDDDIYENSRTYDPFRFSRIRETATMTKTTQGNGGEQKDFTKLLESKNLSTVTTSDTFLSFGHGRHACPGRFFAATEMKLLLACIILNYEFKALEARPPNQYIGGAILPPMQATISIKRRQH
ncbi:cytochrome P450 [Mollisia scopiformis]|uniref:Cytochrome P450 n=1 Tax=Mollisia scopiformis TaxID=149040 RepID=A0A194X2Q1_MOLSC|nr:cytochrome P450 [Mollisia scopiformis]KUJ14117.1 cytochrome P450 [Mollisia scopiformis]